MDAQSVSRAYEFGAEHHGVFRKLAATMSFVALAILVPGAVLTLAPVALLLRQGFSMSEGLMLLPGVLLLVMAANLFGAAQHFRRIVSTSGKDIDNLMVAVSELARVYEIQRWLWIALGLVLLVALLTTRATG